MPASKQGYTSSFHINVKGKELPQVRSHPIFSNAWLYQKVGPEMKVQRSRIWIFPELLFLFSAYRDLKSKVFLMIFQISDLAQDMIFF